MIATDFHASDKLPAVDWLDMMLSNESILLQEMP
jgi:hypothetical protein